MRDAIASFFRSQNQFRRQAISTELTRWHYDRPEGRAIIARVGEAERGKVEGGFRAVMRNLILLRQEADEDT